MKDITKCIKCQKHFEVMVTGNGDTCNKCLAEEEAEIKGK